MVMNITWHSKHPMPARATTEQRVVWHVAHARHCGCREIPPKLKMLIQQKQCTKLPKRQRGSA